MADLTLVPSKTMKVRNLEMHGTESGIDTVNDASTVPVLVRASSGRRERRPRICLVGQFEHPANTCGAWGRE